MKPQLAPCDLDANRLTRHRMNMAEAEDPSKIKRAARDDKLAQALRANLRRRKMGAAEMVATRLAKKPDQEP